MSGRHCDENVTESREYLETGQGTLNEPREQQMNTFTGKVICWRRMAIKLQKLEDTDKMATYKANTKTKALVATRANKKTC